LILKKWLFRAAVSAERLSMSTLYVIGTPIGNLGDITIRALETLRSVDTIACEDTRHTLKLLSHFEIRKPLISCYAYAEEKGAAHILALLEEGKNVAYVSDAGTPSVSDPGSLAVREAAMKGHTVVPIPGPSAFATLVSAAGLFDKTVTFDGFLSPKPGRRRSRLAELMAREEATVLYESPHRIIRLLEEAVIIDPDRYICIGREMTKIHEEFLRGSIREVLDLLAARPSILGEFSIVISGKKKV
jgi:16S rRNA (cytidine1402-2'-O)-methyltransferase